MYQATQLCALADDVSIGTDIGSTGCFTSKRCQIGKAAARFQLVITFQLFSQRHRIQRLVIRGKIGDRFKDQLMITTEEVFGGQTIRHSIPAAVIQHQPAEHGLLGFN